MLHSYGLDQRQTRSFSRRELTVLCGLTFAGMLLRLIYAWGRSYVSDEVGTVILTDYSIFHIMTHFRVWLTMNAFIAAEKVVRGVLGDGPLSLGLIPLIGGVATIPLIALLALRLTTSRTALVAAALLAFDPWHVMYSATIRSYSILACLSVLTILLFLRWYSDKTRGKGALAAVSALLMLLSHLNGICTLAFLLLLAALDFLRDRRRFFGEWRTFLIPLAGAVVIAGVLQGILIPQMKPVMSRYTGTRPSELYFLPRLLSLYLAPGFWGWPFLALLLVSFWHLPRGGEPLALVPLYFIVTLALFSARGTTYFPPDYGRLLIACLPFLVLLVARGVTLAADGMFSPARRSTASAVGTLLLLCLFIPGLIGIFREKADMPWRTVGFRLKQDLRPGDLVVGLGWTDEFHLRTFFREGKETRWLADYCRQPSSDSIRIHLVSSSVLVETRAPQFRAGRIQVVTYARSLPDSTLARIRRDLKKTAGDDLDGRLTDCCKGIYDIGRRLRLSEEDLASYSQWQRCRSLQDSQDDTPTSVMKARFRTPDY